MNLHRAIARLALFAVFIFPGIPIAAAQNTVPAQFHGTWVAGNATCESPVRVQVAAQVLTLFNGNDSAALGGIEMAGPGYFPPGYRGIEAVLFTEFSGHQPAIMSFNAGEKKGVAQVARAIASKRHMNEKVMSLTVDLYFLPKLCSFLSFWSRDGDRKARESCRSVFDHSRSTRGWAQHARFGGNAGGFGVRDALWR